MTGSHIVLIFIYTNKCFFQEEVGRFGREGGPLRSGGLLGQAFHGGRDDFNKRNLAKLNDTFLRFFGHNRFLLVSIFTRNTLYT